MAKWIPDLADQPIEEAMEAQDVPEGDRDEVRRFAEFLRRRQAKQEGRELPPPPEGMREWLLGEEV